RSRTLTLSLVLLTPSCGFFIPVPAPTDISTLSLHDALPILRPGPFAPGAGIGPLFGARGETDEVLHRPGHVLVEQPNRELAFARSEEHTSELQSRRDLVCRLLLEKKKFRTMKSTTEHIVDRS